MTYSRLPGTYTPHPLAHLPGVREIVLTRGFACIVDEGDYENLSRWSWHASVGTGGKPYAMRGASIDGKLRSLSMHRQLLGFPQGLKCDHANWDTLDNRRANLRVCTHAQNMTNFLRKGSAGFRGIVAKGARFGASIRANRRRYWLGRFDTPEEAALAYDKAAIRLQGEFAILNFLEERGVA